MPEQPTIQSPESDLARGLAEFRQGRKSLLPEFELPTDDVEQDTESEVCIERLVVNSFKEILEEVKADERIGTTAMKGMLTKKINEILSNDYGYILFNDAISIGAIMKFFNLDLPEVSTLELSKYFADNKIRNRIIGDFFNEVSDKKRIEFFLSFELSLAKFLNLELPYESMEKALTGIDFRGDLTKSIKHYSKGLDYDHLYKAIKGIWGILYLNIELPELSSDEIFITFLQPDFQRNIIFNLDQGLKFGQLYDSDAIQACEAVLAIEWLISYYSAIAEKKEKEQAAHKLKTAADRTGVPPRPEQKAF